MGRIRRLEPSVVNQIAAGEVVIQPSSAIKELVENSLDAGATRVEVEFSGGGAEMIRVSDNGMGMDLEDLELAVQPHATSKISSAADLYCVTSCGFRGEALASIAEVSRLEIVSRSRDSDLAWRLFRQGDSFRSERASRSVGTTVLARDLFHNVPVRRRFLKSERAETAANLDALRRLAIARPWVGMRVMFNGQTALDLKEDDDPEKRIRSLGVFDEAGKLLSFDSGAGILRARGWGLSQTLHHPNSQKIFIFVNRRPIRDRALAQAFARAYADFIPERRFPGGVLLLDIPPEEVDVNIHPSKSEVRFREPDAVFSLVYRSLRAALGTGPGDGEKALEPQAVYYRSTTPAPGFRPTGGAGGFTPWPGKASATSGSQSQGSTGAPPAEKPAEGTEEPAKKTPGPASPHFTPRSKPGTKAFQFLNSYIILELDDGIAVMDQHAVHERILYHKLLCRESGERRASQMLLSPSRMPLPPALGEVQAAVMAELRAAGYELRQEDGALVMEGIPDWLSPEKAASALEEQLQELAGGALVDKDGLRAGLLSRISCRAAVKAGDPLSAEDASRIAADAVELGLDRLTCPHGRRAVWMIPASEIAGRFDR